MRGRDEEVRDDVVRLQAGTLDTLPAAPLSSVQVGLRALRVARSSDRDDDIFLGDQVLDTDVAVVRDDPGATLIAVLLDDLGQFVRDDLTLAAGPGEDVVVVVDLRRDAGVLIDDPLPLERGQPAQLHIEDGRRLDLIDVEQLHQPAPSRLGGRRSPDERDYGVQLVQRLEQAAQDVDAFLGLAEQVSGAPDDDFDLVLDVMRDELVEAQRARHTVDDREHVRAEGRLQLGVLEQVVQHHLRHAVARQRDDDAHADAVGALVVDRPDAADLLLVDQPGDRLDEVVGVHLVRQFGDDQDRVVPLVLLDLDDRAHADRTASRAVRILDAVAADDQRLGREVRALDELDGLFEQLFGQ